ncbi:MAG: NUDIX domain-containing protein [Alphaproteobacteria bacterium]|nr:NUDIX domain-containing protein [Alphaproteobacteria bacterium]
MNSTEERFDIYGPDGNKTGRVATMGEIYAEQLTIRTVAVWLVNSAGKILVHRDGKRQHGTFGEVRVSVTGRVSAGEAGLDAAQRETLEELGLDFPKDRFEFIKTLFHIGPRYPSYFTDIYVVFTDLGISEMNPDESEVAGLEWHGLGYLKNWKQNKLNISQNFESRLNVLSDWLDTKE